MNLPPNLPPAKIVTVSGGETFVRDQPGPEGAVPALLLHGWTATADLNFFPLYGPLAEQRRVVALDHRHHGRGIWTGERFRIEDAADDAVEVLDRLGIERAVVVGYSLGGAVAQLVAHRHPDRCAGLVLAGTAQHFRGPIQRVAMWRVGWDIVLQRAFVSRHLGEVVLRRAARDTPEVVGLEPWVAAELERGHPGGIRSAGAALSRFDARPLGRHSCPVAVVVTTRDRLVYPRRQRAMAASLGATVVEIDAGHLDVLLAPEAFVGGVLEAVARIAPSPVVAAAASAAPPYPAG